MKKISLTQQLLYICILIVGIIFIALGIILPKELLPIYEENIYNKLTKGVKHRIAVSVFCDF